ncbi:MAG: hypothetical protein C0606_15400 [Hyphomicrobiales bacterium]|nr:MAG: hypothetical protein C0606_15400 [Hyphomicrobiales bacterium]
MHRHLFRAATAIAVILIAPFAALAEEKPAYPTATLDDQHRQAMVTSGRITAALRTEKRTVEGYEETVPVLHVFVDSKKVLEAEGVSAGEWVQGVAEVIEVDAANDLPEVVFSSYSGGAHCCTKVVIATADRAGGWNSVDMGEWDGGGNYMEDADGDGRAEFVAADQNFLYAFDCYACSAAPVKILSVQAGKIVDVSREPRFQPKLKQWAKALEGWRQDDGKFQPGFFAGWIAAKSMIGEGVEAWQAMQKAYKPGKDDGFEVCKDTGLFGECAENMRATVPFPMALKSFLDHHGYRF